jgi:hypothetical protein
MKDWFIIDKEFVDKIRLTYTEMNFDLFNETNHESIVDEKETHDYLLRNFNIHDNIIDFYHLCTTDLISNNEFDKFKNMGHHGVKNRFVRPFSINILGGYHRTCDLVQKLSTIASDGLNISINDLLIKRFQDLEPNFIDYRNGFKNGYLNFDSDNVNKYLTPFADKQDYIKKVFEYITKHILFSHSWQNPIGFTFRGLMNDKANIIKGFENGQKQGYFYKAWSIVFSNNSLFQPLFEDFFKNEIEQKPKVKTKSEKLQSELDKYGFFELELVKQLSQINKERLMDFINSNKLPYRIALFDYLDFFLHLEKEHFKTKDQLYKGVSKWLEADVSGRTVKGNISSLLEYSGENKDRYTAHIHKETVKEDYQKLK